MREHQVSSTMRHISGQTHERPSLGTLCRGSRASQSRPPRRTQGIPGFSFSGGASADDYAPISVVERPPEAPRIPPRLPAGWSSLREPKHLATGGFGSIWEYSVDGCPSCPAVVVKAVSVGLRYVGQFTFRNEGRTDSGCASRCSELSRRAARLPCCMGWQWL